MNTLHFDWFNLVIAILFGIPLLLGSVLVIANRQLTVLYKLAWIVSFAVMNYIALLAYLVVYGLKMKK